MTPPEPSPDSSPEPSPDPPSGGSPEEGTDREVSDLLASFGAAPIPSEVADRLDTTVSRLVAARRATSVGSSRTSVGPHVLPGDAPRAGSSPAAASRAGSPRDRSQRRWPRVLLAAAAVVAGGYGVGHLVSTGALRSGSSEATSADSAAGADRPAAGRAQRARGEVRFDPNRLAQVRADRLPADIRQVLERRHPLGTHRQLSGGGPDQAQTGSADRQPGRCARPALSRGEVWYVVRFEGRPAALVVTGRTGDRAAAQVFSCRSGARLTEARLLDTGRGDRP